MAILYPDKLEHNNPANPLMNDNQLWGSLQVVNDKTARNSIPENKRKIGSTVSWIDATVVTIQKYIGPDTTDLQWTNDLNWQNVMFPFIEQNVVKVLPANATTVIQIGDKNIFGSFVLRYQMIRDTVIGMGTIEIMQNGVTLETPVEFDLREFNGLIGLVSITSAYNGSEIELSIAIDNSMVNDVIMVYDIQRKNRMPAWSLQTSPENGTIYGIFATDINNAWATGQGANQLIIHTTDGGANWVSQTSPLVGSGGLISVYFIDVNNGWAVGAFGAGVASILHTIDGGTNWVEQTSDPLGGSLNSVFFIDSLIGWVGGGAGSGNIVLEKTVDGGVTWIQQSLADPGQIYSIMFSDVNNGWLVGQASGNTIIIYNTTDGGANWTLQTSPVTLGLLNSVSFINSLEGWAAGFDITTQFLILHTIDGGANWVRQTTQTLSGILTGIDFVDANNGWAVGTDFEQSVIFHTNDGGVNWLKQQPASASQLLGVSMVSKYIGFAVGYNQTITKYS